MEHDTNTGKSPEQIAHPGHYVDPCGGLTPLAGIAAKLQHFGLEPSVVDDVFR